jgi:hypothetical protein
MLGQTRVVVTGARLPEAEVVASAVTVVTVFL